MTAETEVRLGLAFDIDPQIRLNLQAQYDIEVIPACCPVAPEAHRSKAPRCSRPVA